VFCDAPNKINVWFFTLPFSCFTIRNKTAEKGTKNMMRCIKRGGWIVLSVISLPINALEVRKSKANLCHQSSSPNYITLENFVAYSNLTACLDSGELLTREDRAKFHDYNAWVRASYPEVKNTWGDGNGEDRTLVN
jgi:hypothetical protein